MDVWRPGELGPHRVASVSPQYEKALLRGYVESCSNLTWCTNPQGCDRILCRQGLGCGTTCSKCGWASCFSCSFPEVGACPAMPLSTACTPPLPALLSITHTHIHTYNHRLRLVITLCHQLELCSSSCRPPYVTPPSLAHLQHHPGPWLRAQPCPTCPLLL